MFRISGTDENKVVEMKLNKSTIQSFIINLILFNNNLEIQNLTFIFIDKISSLMKGYLKQYARSILMLNKDVINIFMLNILFFKNSKELNERINDFLSYIYMTFKNYKLGEFVYEL